MESGVFTIALAAVTTGMIILIIGAFLARRIPILPVKVIVSILIAALFGLASFWATGASTYFMVGTEQIAIPIGVVGGLIGVGATFLIVFRPPGAKTAPRPARASRSTTSRQQPRDNTPSDVFISYKRDERSEVLQIAERLRALKLKVWFDADLRSGTSFDSEIDRHIRRAKCVLACWSPGAVASDWVRGEATIGRERGVLAAAILKPCDLPAPFNLVHAEDLTVGIGPENRAWFRLLDRIGALVGRPGLGAYELAVASRDRGAIAAWMGEHPHDPLFDEASALLRSI